MCVLKAAEGPQLCSHIIMVKRPDLSILEISSPNFPNLCVFLPSVETCGKETKAILRFAQDATQAFFDATTIFFLTLGMDLGDLLRSQSILFE